MKFQLEFDKWFSHPIISAVLAGTILWFVSALFDRVISTDFVGILLYNVYIPFGLLIPLTVFLFLLVLRLRKYSTKISIEGALTEMPSIEDLFEIDLRPRHRSVHITQPDNPEVQIYLDVRNPTSKKLVLDRIVAKFTYGVELTTINHLRVEEFEPWEKRFIYLTAPIPKEKADTLAFQYQKSSSNCWLHVYAQCSYDNTTFTFERTLDGIKPSFLNEHLLQVDA